MSETLNTQAAAPAAPSSGTPSGGGASFSPEASAPGSPPGGGESGAQASSSAQDNTAKVELKGKSNATQNALRRAMERRDSVSAQNTQISTPAGAEQAGKEAVSTPSTPEGASGADNGTQAISGNDQNGQGQSVSTVTAPNNWPANLRDRFEKIADNGARSIVLDTYKDLQAGYTRAMQKQSQREQELSALVEMNSRFNSGAEGAKEVLSNLAKQAGMEVWFERPLPKGEIPEFNDAREMALWAKEEAKRELANERAAEAAKTETETERKAFRTSLESEIKTALEKIPGFESHAQNVSAVIRNIMSAKRPSVEQAYMIATYPTVQKMAAEANEAKAQVAKLTKQIEDMRKKATTPPTPRNGASQTKEVNQSPTQRALAAAMRRKAAANARA